MNAPVHRIARRLFASHFLVVLAGTLVFALAAYLRAPVAFENHMETMGSMMGSGSMMPDQLRGNFLAAVGEILLVSGISAAVAALVASTLLSWRIVGPLRALLAASQRIASGDYSRRLEVSSDDELGELALSFNTMAEKLDQTENRRSELIGNVAHELRTPLASIRSMMEALVDGVLPADAATFVDVQREASRLERLADDLVELSRAELGALPLELNQTDLGTVVDNAVQRLRPQFTDKGIDLTLKLPPGRVPVNVDTDRIVQVIVNLLGNALQYTDSGGRVQLETEVQGSTAMVSVTDNGIGMAGPDLDRVFERFYRVDKSRARTGGGSGIGLTISRLLVQAHGGTIAADSDGVGRGSTFSFTLPIS